MANIVSRKKSAAPKEPKVKKFKNFKLTIEFTDRDDAMAFAEAINEYNHDIATTVVENAHR